ncbi:hypothetical protein G6F43_014146 [Rhizopus delemar]|nr:hypothetical protein G6F43_014146 [Rhizopus delemar]
MSNIQEAQENSAANTQGLVYLDTVENYVKNKYQLIASTIIRIESKTMEQQEASMADEEENEEENNEVILDDVKDT